MADAPRSQAWKVSASFSCGDKQFAVSSFTVEWGVNRIPSAKVVIPLTCGVPDGASAVYTGPDASAAGKDSSYACVQAAADKRGPCTLTFDVKPVTGKTSGDAVGLSMVLEGWLVSQATLEPQVRKVPGGVVVHIEHPISKLADTPGFFAIADPSFLDSMLSAAEDDKNVIEVADTVLSEIAGKMDRAAESFDGQNFEEIQDALKELSISAYIDTEELAGIFPYVHLFQGDPEFVDLITKSCKRSLARQFMRSVSVENGSTPWGAFVGTMASLGAYVRVLPQSNGEKAKLCVLQPWENRSYPSQVQDSTVYMVRVLPDSQPICGIRIQGLSENEASVQSTQTSQTVIDPGDGSGSEGAGSDKKAAVGDTVYYHKAYGTVLTVTVPSFAMAMIGEAAAMQASGRGSHSTTDERRLVSYDQLDNELYDNMQVVVGSKIRAEEMMNDLLKETAKSTFSSMFRSKALAEITMPAVVEYPAIPLPGSLVGVSVGVGDTGLSGILQSVVVHGSCQDGSCMCTYVLSHAGTEGSAPAGLRNTIWT